MVRDPAGTVEGHRLESGCRIRIGDVERGRPAAIVKGDPDVVRVVVGRVVLEDQIQLSVSAEAAEGQCRKERDGFHGPKDVVVSGW